MRQISVRWDPINHLVNVDINSEGGVWLTKGEVYLGSIQLGIDGYIASPMDLSRNSSTSQSLHQSIIYLLDVARDRVMAAYRTPGKINETKAVPSSDEARTALLRASEALKALNKDFTADWLRLWTDANYPKE